MGGNLASQLALVAASFPIARSLGASEYGLLTFVVATTSTLSSLAGPSLSLASAKLIAEVREKSAYRAARIARAALTGATIAGMLLTMLLLAVLQPIADAAGQRTALEPALRVGAVLVVLGTVQATSTGVLLGLERFRAAGVASIVRGGSIAFLSVFLATHYGLLGCVLGLVAGGLVGLVVSLIWARAPPNGAPGSSDAGWVNNLHSVLSFAVPSSIGGIAVFASTWAVTLLVTSRFGGPPELGVFGAANQWRTGLLLLPQLVSQPLFPILSRLSASGSAAIGRVRSINVWVAAVSATGPAAIVAVAAPAIMGSYGAGFSTRADVLLLACLSVPFNATSGAIGNTILSTGHVRLGLALNVAWSVLFVLAFLAIPAAGATRIAGAYCLSYVAHMALSVIVQQRILREPAGH